MDNNIVTLNGSEITLIKVGINNQLNTKQKALLEMMYKCMTDKIPFNWDAMVDFYIKNCKSKYNYYSYDYDWDSPNISKKNQKYIDYDIKKCYKENNTMWSYNIKPSIRQWFATNIGSMVLKGSILALPVIELN